MKLSKSLLAVAISLSAASSQATVSPNLVDNGSFESGTTTVLTGWVIKNNGTVDFSYESPQNGLRFIDLDNIKVAGARTLNGTISQSIEGTGLVNLSFWYAANSTNPGSTNEVKFELAFSIGKVKGSVLGSSVNGTEWQRHTQLVDLGTGGTANLSFTAAGAKDGIGGYIDNVSITAVPEPATYAMLLAGLGLMSTIALGHKKNREKRR